MCHCSRPLGLLLWCFLLLFTFVIGDPYAPPDIICLRNPVPSNFNPKDCEHILSTFPALHFDLSKQWSGSSRPILSLPLRAQPYKTPARFTYKTCRVEYAAFGVFKQQGSRRNSGDSDSSSTEVLSHVHRRGQTTSRPKAAPLTEEQKAFYLWPQAREMGVAILKKCLAERHALGEARGQVHVPETGMATRAGVFSSPITTTRKVFFNIKLEPSSAEVDERYLWPHFFSALQAVSAHVYDLSPDVFYTPSGSPSHGESST